MSISREQLLTRVREEGYSFKRQTDKVDLYRKKGSTDRITIDRNKSFEESYVRVVLKQAGLTDEDITALLAACVKH